MNLSTFVLHATRTAMAGLALTACCGIAAQTIRVTPTSPFRPQLNIGGSISVTATPAAVSFNLVAGGTATASVPITISTVVSNLGLLSSFSLYAYFSSTAALTSAEGARISSSDVWASSDAQPTYQSFTGSSPFAANSSVLVFRTSSLLDLASQRGHQNTLTLKIDLSDAPNQPAGQYAGSLILQAQAL